jgi:magnesium transporter
MNFQFMPELHWHYGYFLVLAGIMLVCAGLWLRFKLIGWL